MPDSKGEQKLIIITAPSGSGKSTIVRYLLQEMPDLSFSVSACTRSPRPGETHGVSYYFISVADFQQKINAHEFAEYEMVYEGKYYGTLNSELTRIWNNHQFPLVDIDVQGALRLKKQFEEKALTIFIQAPSMEELEKRLRGRGTETEASLQERLNKAREELMYAKQFDTCIVNDHLATACENVANRIRQFLAD
ncbi:MAG: guanylate kinase [Chitinophagaceae bacterium]|nr:guanylate kinase [Chitinophagaceae bacterium]